MKNLTLILAFALSALSAQAQTEAWYETAAARGSVGVARAIHDRGYVKLTIFNAAPVAFDSLEAEFSEGLIVHVAKGAPAQSPLLITRPTGGAGSHLTRLTIWRAGRREDFAGDELNFITYTTK